MVYLMGLPMNEKKTADLNKQAEKLKEVFNFFDQNYTYTEIEEFIQMLETIESDPVPYFTEAYICILKQLLILKNENDVFLK